MDCCSSKCQSCQDRDDIRPAGTCQIPARRSRATSMALGLWSSKRKALKPSSSASAQQQSAGVETKTRQREVGEYAERHQCHRDRSGRDDPTCPIPAPSKLSPLKTPKPSESDGGGGSPSCRGGLVGSHYAEGLSRATALAKSSFVHARVSRSYDASPEAGRRWCTRTKDFRQWRNKKSLTFAAVSDT